MPLSLMNPTIVTVCIGRRARKLSTSVSSAGVRRFVITSTGRRFGAFVTGVISAIEFSSGIVNLSVARLGGVEGMAVKSGQRRGLILVFAVRGRAACRQYCRRQ